MHRLNKAAVLLLLALCAARLVVPGAAQSPPEKEAVFRAETRLVPLYTTVLDSRGHLVTDLPREAFTVLENGAPQALKIFRREDVPVSMGLIVDNSGSMRDKRQKVNVAALALVKASHRQDEIFIVNFNDEAYLDVPFTGDIQKMEEGLTRIDSRGGTAMRDAIWMSIDYLKEKGKKDKKVLLVITDGNDNTSNPDNTLEKLVQKAQQSEVLLYAIGLLNEEERREAKRAERALKALATASGGLSYFPKELDEVQTIATQVAHEIRNQYVLAYSPTNQVLDGSYRRIQVQVKGPNKPVARTRSGYYATPQPKPRPGDNRLISPGDSQRP